MELRINKNYMITSDANCLVLNKVLLNKITGKEYISPIGYYGSFESLVDGLIFRELCTAEELTSMEKIKDHINCVRNDIIKCYENK